MNTKRISYKDGYKYQLQESYCVQTTIHPSFIIKNQFFILDTDGLLTIREGYAWDGATCCPDMKKILRGSLIHDVLYQMMREGMLDIAMWRKSVDKELQKACIEDGMPSALAWIIYQAVNVCGKNAALPRNDRRLLTSP